MENIRYVFNKINMYTLTEVEIRRTDGSLQIYHIN